MACYAGFYISHFMMCDLVEIRTLPTHYITDLSSLGGVGGARHPQILADRLTLSQLGGADYARHPRFSDLPTALNITRMISCTKLIEKYESIS